MRLSRAPPAHRTRRTMDKIMQLLVLTLCGLVAGEPLGRLVARQRDAIDVYAREFAHQYEPYMFAAIPLHAPVPVLRVLTRVPLQPTPLQGRQALNPTLRHQQHAPDAQAASSAQYASYARPYLPAVHYPQYADQTRLYPQVQQYAAEPARQYSQSTRHYAKPARPYSADDYEATSYEFTRPAYYPKPRRQVSSVNAPSAYEYAADYDSYPQQLQAQPSPLPQLTYAIAPYDSEAFASHEAAPTVLYARPSPSGGYTYRRVANAISLPKKKAPLKEKENDPPFIVKIHKYKIVKDDLI